MAKYKTIIGRAETIDMPEYFLTDIPSKTDTGAYMSAIHATNIREVKSKNGKKILKCDILSGHPSYNYGRELVFKNYYQKPVENSFGVSELRYAVKVKVKLAGKVFYVDVNLADRSKKPFPVLLGRTLLNNRFMVDTDIAHIDRKLLKEKLKDWLAKDDKYDEKDIA